MSLFTSIAIASMVGAFLAVRIIEYVLFGVVGSLLGHALRASFFVAAWTAVTTGMGMRAFTARVRKLRQTIVDRR